FYDRADQYHLSTVAKHFIAGQLAHARAMCALVAPLVNSYKRFVPGFEAPVAISWAQMNRSALIRVPRAGSGDRASVRIEFRAPDPSCNPYLAFAAMLHAGLSGIRQKLPLPPPVEENLYDWRRQGQLLADPGEPGVQHGGEGEVGVAGGIRSPKLDPHGRTIAAAGARHADQCRTVHLRPADCH